jgi:ribonuclease-3
MENLDQLEKKLAVVFRDKNLLTLAITHRSYLNENKSHKLESNERLEFLGDAVLSLIVSSHIYNKNKELDEGKLTNLRSLIVRTKTLALIANNLKLGQFLLLSKGETLTGGRNNETLLADTYEAILGAIYIDQGLDAASKFVNKTLIAQIGNIISDDMFTDYKSALQQKIQENYHMLPVYKITKESGPDHLKKFTVGVFLNDKLLGQGVGKNKQEAEQQAAKESLVRLNRK